MARRSKLHLALIVATVLQVGLLAAGALALALRPAGPAATAAEGGAPVAWLDVTPAPVREVALTPRPTTTPVPTSVPWPTWTPGPTLPPKALPTATPRPSPTPTPLPTDTPWPTPTPLQPRIPHLPWFPTPTLPPLPDSVEVPIVFYHYVDYLPEAASGLRRSLTVSPATLDAQLQYLVDAGFQTITLDDLYAALVEGRPLPERPIVLSFDGGYRDAYDNVFPLLKRRGLIGTFFILTSKADGEAEGYLTWAMIEEMSRAGMDIQPHGRDHTGLAGVSYEYVLHEVRGAREAIEAHVGRPARFFCYPYGTYDDSAIAALQAAGFLGALTTREGRVHTRDDLYTLARIRIGEFDGVTGFAEKIGAP